VPLTTSQRPRASPNWAWWLGSVAILAGITIADLLVSGVVLAGLVVLAPLFASIRLRPRSVAVIGAGALVVAVLSSSWNPTTGPQEIVRVGLVLAGSTIAMLIAVVRWRLERERRLERMLGDLIGSTMRSPEQLVHDIAGSLVPGFADGTRVELLPVEGAPALLLAEAGCPVPARPAGEQDRATIRHGRGDGWTLSGPLRIGDRIVGSIDIHRDGRRFHPADAALFDRLAERVALALENSTLLAASRELAGRVDAERRRLRTVIDQMPAAVTLRDRDGVPVITNPRAREIQRRATGDIDAEVWFAAHPGRRLDGTPVEPEEWPHHRSLRSGEVVRGEEYEFERRDGSWAVTRINSGPIRDEDGHIDGVVSVFDDVSDQVRDRRALRWLAEVGRLLDRPTSAEARVEEIVRLLVGELADAGLVYLVGADGSITSSMAVGRDAADRELEPGPLAADHPASVAVSTQRSLILDLPDDWLASAGFATALVVPIVHAQSVHGSIVLATRSPRHYDPRDVQIIELVARRVALALENSRLYAEQHRVATALQRDLLPDTLPDWPGFDLATLYRPARGAADVGGDFFDLFEARDERMIVIGDVSGKGVEAAATTALVRHVVRVAGRSAEQGRRIQTVNQAILEDSPGEQFCTLAWAALEPANADGVVAGRVACAGHPPPFVLRAGGAVEMLAATGTLLGFFPEIESETAPVQLAAGDALVLYTDGVTEARLPDGSLFGLEGLSAALPQAAGAPAAEILEAIEGTLEHVRAEARDDIAIVVASVL
jgi:serine phosphatase RsbU (regulator of sigma subunit)/PAS domain-containing protein